MSPGYFQELADVFFKITVTCGSARDLSVQIATARIIDQIACAAKNGSKVILIGNGGSASIASHIATDFLKNVNIPACAFNDGSLLTCLSNDLGYEQVFVKPVEMMAKKGDVLFSISSSGKSVNILNATAVARKKGCFIVTLSGFEADNPLRQMGDFNFYVPSHSYGYVEIAHLALCHAVADGLMERRGNG